MEPGVVTAGGLALALIGTVAAWAIRINKGEEALKLAKDAKESADAAKAELANYKVHVAETYVSHTNLAELERRLTDSIKAVGDRLERLFHPTPPAP
jgi:hypothetical protein